MAFVMISDYLCGMKSAAVCGLMMLYLVVLLRPALPSLIYYAQQDYFAAELCMFRDQPRSCCKGSCQLARMAHESNGNSNENPLLRLQSEELIVVLPLDQAIARFSRRDSP
jgi:hypothetical protein